MFDLVMSLAILFYILRNQFAIIRQKKRDREKS